MRRWSACSSSVANTPLDRSSRTRASPPAQRESPIHHPGYHTTVVIIRISDVFDLDWMLTSVFVWSISGLDDDIVERFVWDVLERDLRHLLAVRLRVHRLLRQQDRVLLGRDLQFVGNV